MGQKESVIGTGNMSVDDMIPKAATAANYLKALSNETRLAMLCHLVEGPKTVGELEDLVGARQANVSQHLARLKEEGLVSFERSGKSIAYAIADADALDIFTVLHRKFCAVNK